MHSFPMKKPLDPVDLDKVVKGIDKKLWGNQGSLVMQELNNIRDKMRAASGIDIESERAKKESNFFGDIISSFSSMLVGNSAPQQKELSTTAVMLKRQRTYDRFGVEDVENCRTVMAQYQMLASRADQICLGMPLQDFGVSFNWSEAFDRTPHSAPSWSYERACAVFNLAAVISYLATHQNRSTDEGIKAAAGLFQQAAGALVWCKWLADEGTWPRPSDMSEDTLCCLESLMLAQAQKTFVEKAVRDGLSDKITCMLAAECAGMYAECVERVDAAVKGGRPISAMASKSAHWLEVVRWNAALWDGVQHFYAARLDGAQSQYGAQVGRLHYALAQVTWARDACVDDRIKPVMEEWHGKVSDEYAAAKKDNDDAYHEIIRAVADLPALERKSMVRSTPPPEETEQVPIMPKLAGPPSA